MDDWWMSVRLDGYGATWALHEEITGMTESEMTTFTMRRAGWKSGITQRHDDVTREW